MIGCGSSLQDDWQGRGTRLRRKTLPSTLCLEHIFIASASVFFEMWSLHPSDRQLSIGCLQAFYGSWAAIKAYSTNYEHTYEEGDFDALGLILESDGGDCWVREVDPGSQSPDTLIGMKIKKINNVDIALVENNHHLDPNVP